MSAEKKNKGGRPTKYKAEFAKQAVALCQHGFTDQELADFFGCEVRTIYRWQIDHPEFCQAIKAGGDVADDRVERTLYQRACGYEQAGVKVFMPAGAKTPVYAPIVEKIAPDVASMIFWLKNRRKDRWRDKTESELTGKDGTALVPVLNVSLARNKS